MANAATFFVDRHMAEGRADKPAFVEADGKERVLTYGQLHVESGRFAGALGRHGVRREERIAMIVRDQIEWPVVFWGAMKAGAIPVPLNTLLSSDVYETILTDSRASILVVSEEMWEVVEPATRDNAFLRAILVIGDAPEMTESYRDFTDGAPEVETVAANDDELAFWLYSSGSTGQPKGVRHVHGALKATCETFGDQVLGIREDDVVYSVAKMFFAYGLGNAVSFPQSVGATTVLFGGRPTPPVVFDILAKHRPSILCAVPTLFAALVQAADGAPKHGLRLCTSAGEALPRDVGEGWDRLTGVEIVDGVGSTEMLHIFLSNAPGDCVYGTSGTAVPGYELRLVNEHDEELADGEVGELLVRGPSSADGYWNRRAKSQATFEGMWTRTGDKYERKDGRYIYCGRTDDMFKVSGIWVSPFEVESALVDHASVLEAAVVARADEAGLDKPAAFVVLTEGAEVPEAEALKAFVKDKIGMWKYPRWVEIVEDLPKTATGKIQRFKLRA
ncbi:benzoate-CoA ligase family protein [Jannaschia sp. CCS1]|uniref:benzoate-CoA ligase family protein n=1 Tax=Jannaschia sp. (strain CCS1) TaxID=290400 RepID=UPI000053BFED|nr:benzoate-CoA ligase family protein [Jannaschia sp. CCS1]ABD53586.1 benzoate-CoA ligase [Jannaschia sp. CCS1]